MIGIIVFAIVCGVIMSLYPKETGALMRVSNAGSFIIEHVHIVFQFDRRVDLWKQIRNILIQYVVQSFFPFTGNWSD